MVKAAAGSCCAMPSDARASLQPPPALDVRTKLDPTGMALIPGGSFRMGSNSRDAVPGDGEGPVREVDLPAFLIDSTAVTAAAFAVFAAETGHRTDAERHGWSLVFASAVHPRAAGAILPGAVPGLPWWLGVRGASWRAPDGPGSDWAERPGHPAVHVSWNDARAFAAWCGKRLPSEAEWEKAARGGLDQARYPWGDELMPAGRHVCNIWQGSFPDRNTAADGYLTTAPADAFPPNGYGLHNMAGNVWEWCADPWSVGQGRHGGPMNAAARVIRGGSYLCHASYCNRYRVAARSFNTADSSTGHMGFRCAADA